MQNEEIIYEKRVLELLEIPQPAQRTKEWFEQRMNALTSSDVDTVLGLNKYSKPEDVLFKKCGLGKPFNGNVATRHGQKYEDEAVEHYCRIYSKKSLAFGLLPHPTISWLAGSPDGITTDGIVIEVKCPLYRKIDMGNIPNHYISQIKMNMEICNLDRAVFIEYIPKHMSKTGEMILNVVHLDREPSWFDGVYNTLHNFWNDVLKYRNIGIDKHNLYPKYLKYSNQKPINDISLKDERCLILESDDDGEDETRDKTRDEERDETKVVNEERDSKKCKIVDTD